MRVHILKKKSFFFTASVTLAVSLSPLLLLVQLCTTAAATTIHSFFLLSHTTSLSLSLSLSLFLPVVLIESDKQGILYLDRQSLSEPAGYLASSPSSPSIYLLPLSSSSSSSPLKFN